MRTYSSYKPSAFDTAGLGMPDRQDWLVAPCGRNRDSDTLAESNWYAQARRIPEGEDAEICRFGHWACGWFEILIVRPGSAAATEAEKIERKINDYPILDESDHSGREQAEADRVWECMEVKERIEYIRDHRSQFEFYNFADMLGCVRGRYFAGYASELLY